MSGLFGGNNNPDPPPPPPPPRPPNQLGAKQLSMASLRAAKFPQAGFRSLIRTGISAGNPPGITAGTSQTTAPRILGRRV